MLSLRFWFVLVAAAVLVSITACKKSAEKSGPAIFTIKGASEVIGALDRKDYEAVIRGMAEVKAALAPEQREEYGRLLRKVKDTMLDRMSTDEAAAKAYQGLRLLESGR